ncbi:MAG: helix-turn-helix domain-containing protein [Planctomycetia bacterium]
MRRGGHLTPKDQRLEAVLVSANHGLTPFPKTRWVMSRWNDWVIDIIFSNQRQRIGTGEAFLRKAGTVALYRPKLRYYEWQSEGRSQHESWVIFKLSGSMHRLFLDLTADGGYCHLRDPERLIAEGLRNVSGHVHHRRKLHALRAQADFLEIIGLVATSHPVGQRLRQVRREIEPYRSRDLVAVVERFIKERIADPLKVADLAKHVGTSVSTFAHTYPALAGESPHRTIVRLKNSAAKSLLVRDRLTVREVAHRLGYSTEYQFSRSFKRVEGLSPLNYVRSMTTKEWL